MEDNLSLLQEKKMRGPSQRAVNSEKSDQEFSRNSSWWIARLTLTLILLILYGWAVFEPFAGDALMHMMDDTQIKSLDDVLRAFYSNTNPNHHESYRLVVFHRPVFNELFVTLLKEMFGNGSVWIRVSTLTMIIGIAWAFLLLMKMMQVNVLPATVAAVWLVLAPSLFFGLYEFGLAFSQLMVLTAVFSVITLKKYIDTRSKPWLAISLLTTAILVFTKESAVTWPIICILLIFLFNNYSSLNKHILSFRELFEKVTSAIVSYKYSIFLFALLVPIYFFTRYIKLGSFTAIAGGIEQNPSLIDALIKFLGFTLLSLQVPTEIIPTYMAQSIFAMSSVEMFFRFFVFIYGALMLVVVWRKSRIASFVLLISFILAFIPIIKVSRNSPNYGDLMGIPLSIAIALGTEFVRQRIAHRISITLSISTIILLILIAGFFSSGYVYNTNMWLARAQGFARSALFDFTSSQGSFEAEQIVGASGMFSHEQNWALNHNKELFGSVFVSNLGVPSEKFISSSERLLFNSKVMFIDFDPDMKQRKLGSHFLPGYGRLYTAYFPTGYIKKALERKGDHSFNVENAAVVRLECGNKFNNNFSISFHSRSGTTNSRVVESQMNLKSSQQNIVFEFVPPPNIKLITLHDELGGNCISPMVYGYLPFDPNSLD